MQQEVLQFFHQHPQLAIGISLLVSIIIAVAGVVPSVFITGANILFFGFWPGLLLSFLGEAIGAAAAFFLYRKGFQKTIKNKLSVFPKAAALINAEGSKAFGLILSTRLLPFVPSGLITFAAAIGRVSTWMFIIASSVGKIPALFIEGYAVYKATQAGWEVKLVLALIAVALFIFVLRKNGNKQSNHIISK